MYNRNFWGWGLREYQLAEDHKARYIPFLMNAFELSERDILPIPNPENILLEPPSFRLPQSLQVFCTRDKMDRLGHCYGKAFRDIWRGLNNHWDRPPDYVAYPRSEEDIISILKMAEDLGVAVIPYGGGSSVCGGVEAPRKTGYKGVISVDMKNLDQVLEVDHKSRSALIEAGIFGPSLEKKLQAHGYSLRHFPQSFEYSTLGGWIATRSGGHFATLYTHIDEFVQSVRLVTPRGTIQTRRLPGHGAGPSEERFYCGSEGALGIITQAWMRVQHKPVFKDTATLHFGTFDEGVEACRNISQSGLNPSNARLVDPMEAFSNGLGDGSHAVLILGFESHIHPVTTRLEEAVNLGRKFGGHLGNNEVHKKSGDKGAKAWKKSFFLAPYLRDELIRRNIIVETFETAITWDRFEVFHREIMTTARDAIKAHAEPGFITCRFTHLYPDGPAPYYSIIAKGQKGRQLDQWDSIKNIMSQKIIELGGPITHHHAVGKDHTPYYNKQRSTLFGEILHGAKRALDPKGIMNPETLLNFTRSEFE